MLNVSPNDCVIALDNFRFYATLLVPCLVVSCGVVVF